MGRRATLSCGIGGFNHSQIAGLEPTEVEVRFFIFARDDAGVVVGGIRAAGYWNTLRIELLWLLQTLREQGAGRTMMTRTGAFARERGCQVALVGVQPGRRRRGLGSARSGRAATSAFGQAAQSICVVDFSQRG